MFKNPYQAHVDRAHEAGVNAFEGVLGMTRVTLEALRTSGPKEWEKDAREALSALRPNLGNVEAITRTLETYVRVLRQALDRSPREYALGPADLVANGQPRRGRSTRSSR